MIRPRSVVAFLVLTLCCSLPLFAQSDRGSITGTVMDTSGAVVPNATVTATSLATGEVRTATSTDSGSYTIPQLKAETYKVSATAQGFKTATVEEVKVAVQVDRTVDFQLQVGAQGEAVTVTAEAPVIQTESAVNQTNVTERQVRELPLLVSAETAGRTPLAFIFLDSNVSSTSGNGTNASNFRVNGGQGLGTEILIDGAATRRAQNGTFFSEVAPGPNAFQEFTISTSSYSAEYGNSTGGVVNFTIKSGGSGFHGEAWELLRNEVFNANTFLHNNVAPGREPVPKDRDRQHDFGANIGGPLWPGNRAFFFFNYNGYRNSRSETVDISVPTARMRTGDFGELLTDPYVLSFFGGPVQIFDPTQPPGSRTAIPGNRIDLYNGGAIIDPVGLNAVRAFPAPTRPGVYRNYTARSTTPLNMNSYIGKLDFVLTDKQRLNASYSYRESATIKGCCGNAGFTRFPEPYVAFGAWDQTFDSHFVRLQHDYTITPTLLNHFNVGFTRFVVANRNFTEGMQASSMGLPANATQNKALPIFNFPGYGDVITSRDPRSYQGIGSTFFSDRLADNGVDITNFITWVAGRHTLKFGGNVRPQQFNVHQLIHPGGEFNFRHDQTTNSCCPNNQGWPIASLITGATEFSFNSVQSIDPGWRQFTHSYFFNDDWKVTPRLTVNLGLRYDLPGLRRESQNRFRGFDPNTVNPVAGRLGAIVGAAGQGGLQAEYETLAKPDYSNWGPRVGLAYQLYDRTVIRLGGGVYYAPILYGFGGNNTLTEGTLGYSTGGPNINGGAGGTPDLFLRNYRSVRPVNPNGQFLGDDVDFFDVNFKTGRTIQYSADIQQELPGNFMFQIGYVGHRATRLRSDFGRLNALSIEHLKLGAPLLEKNINAVTAADRAYASSVGVTIPASAAAVFPGFNGSVAQALRPFPQYGYVRNQLESQGQSWYNALNLRLDRRFSRGLQFGANYTWAKLITDASDDLFGGSPVGGVVQNPYDRRSLRATSPSSPLHAIAINYLYELPFGHGRRWLNSGFGNAIFGGWQVGGVQRYQGGTPLVIRSTGNRGNDFLNLFGVRGSLRPNITGTVTLAPEPGTAGVSYRYLERTGFAAPTSFYGPFGAADIGSAAYRAYYANPSLFFGNARPTIGERGPGFASENLTIMKKTNLTERYVLELRADMFNIFNRHRYVFTDNDIANAGAFGNVGLDTGYEPRVIQLGARFIF